jgi:hypothetical protein
VQREIGGSFKDGAERAPATAFAIVIVDGKQPSRWCSGLTTWCSSFARSTQMLRRM